MKANQLLRQVCNALIVYSMVAASAHAGLTDISTDPMVTGGTSVTAKPNVVFMLDDSGSMGWNYMPDTAKNFSSKYGFNSSQCNGVYYDPSYTYPLPVKSDGTTYPNATFSAAWIDGFNTSDGTTDLNNSFYYTYTGSQTSEAQRNFQDSSSTFYQECNSSIGSAPGNAVFTKTTLTSATPTTTITVAGSGGSAGATITITAATDARLGSITVSGTGGGQIMSRRSSSSSSTSTVATNIASRINACTYVISDNCTVTGYSATVSGSTITISGPATSGATLSLVMNSGSMSYTTTDFPSVSATTVSSITVNGTELLTSSATGSSPSILANDIRSKISATDYSATVSGSIVTVTGPSSAGGHTPSITIASGTMTLTAPAFPPASPAADLQNFANWYSYYHTRMLTMKSGVGRAFSTLTSDKRVGFMTMNNNVSPGIVDIADFNGGCAVDSGTCQKDKWYSKLYASNPNNSTPLREALSHVGQWYAHKFGTTTTYTSTITVGGSGDTSVDSITVGGVQLMNDSSVADFSTSQVASNIADQINAKLVTEYGATVTGNVITIFGPASAFTPSVRTPIVSNDGGGMTFTATAFTSNTSTAQLNGITPADPMQYSCQQNYIILSTDGYWNGSTTYKLDNTTVGQQDGNEPRPLNDGYTLATKTTTQITRSTSQENQGTQQLQSSTKTLQIMTSQLQSSTSNLQSSTMYLQTSTSSNWGSSWGSWSGTASCTWDNSGSSRRRCRYVTTSGGSSVWTAGAATWTNAASCTKNYGTGTSGTWSGNGTNCQYSAYTSPTSVSSCTVVTQDTTSPYTTPTATQCSYLDGVWTDATTTCTTMDKSVSSPYTVAISTQCQYSTGAWVNASSCTEGAVSPSSPYTILSATSCQTTSPTFVAVAPGTCTPSTSGGLTTTCEIVTSGPTAVASCTNASASAGNNYTTTTCNTVTVGPTQTASCTAAAASAGNNYTTTTCTPASSGTSDTLADVAEYYYLTDLRDQSLGNCTGALGTSVCSNNVPNTEKDPAKYQHLTTFTIGLGTRGKMTGSANYDTLTTSCDPATDGDFCSVLKGATANGSTICSWQSSGTVCNWPIPSSGAIQNIDDLWHAALNGRGSYFSARNSSALSDSLTTALSNIEARLGAAAAAATSNPNASLGDNFVFNSTFKSVDWTGELVRQQIDLASGAVSTTTDWKAQAALDTLAATSANGGSRNIYTYNPSATAYSGDSTTLNNNKLKSFTYANLTATEQAYFSAAHIAGLTQFCASGAYCLSGADKTTAATTNLVNFLRGERSHEGTLSNTSTFYHKRAHILGDIVNAKVAYVKQAQYSYGDTGYSDFVTAKVSRSGMVYAAANDGMLHAFKAGGTTITSGDGAGDEAWAYIPALVLPNLYKLADKNYATQHRYFVDGTPVTGDICPSAPDTNCTASQWKTILVGGLNMGGRGYYALDVTDPNSPKALWEFTDENMGYTFGNPQITKLADGSWVVLLSSGLNNIPNADGTGGDGIGRLYVLDAYTGNLIRSISTGVGDTTTPSGLGRISARVQDPTTDNTALEVYGGDMLGNLWRFDINNDVGSSSSSYEAQLLAILKDPSGVVQPITTKPEVGIVSNQLVVFVGTGRLLGDSDLTDMQVQTMYAIKDPLATTSVAGTAIYNNPRSSTCDGTTTTACFVQQTATNTTCPNTAPASICAPNQPVRTSSNNSVDFNTQNGWYINLPDSGERDNTNPVLALGTLGFVSNTPEEGDACTVLGYSFRWFLNYATGGAVSTSTDGVISTELDATHFGTDLVYVSLPTGSVVELTRTSDGTTVTSNVTIGGGAGSTRRTSWRELTQ